MRPKTFRWVLGAMLLALAACSPSGEPAGGNPAISPEPSSSLGDLPFRFRLENAIGECTILLDGEPHRDYRGNVHTASGASFELDDLPNGTHSVGVRCENGEAATSVAVDLPDGITYETGTAQEYAASIGLPVNAAPFDADGHFTNWEKAYLDFLATLHSDGRFTPDDLAAWMEYAGNTAGPMLVRSVQETFESWKHWVQYESWLRFYPGVNGAFTLKGFLPDWWLPARVADPSISGVSHRLNNYPINYAAHSLDNMTWNPERTEPYYNCWDVWTPYKDHGSGEPGDEGMNFPFHITYMDMDERPHYPYGHPFLKAAKVTGITPHVWDETSMGGYQWREYNYHVAIYIPTYDRKIIDTPDHVLHAVVSHVVHPDKNMSTVEEMPYQQGDYVPYQGRLGVLAWQPIGAFNGDLGIHTEAEGMPYTVAFPAYDGIRHYTEYHIDPVCAAWYPKDPDNPYTQYNRGFTDVRWVQDPTIFAPLINRTTREWDPVPTR